MRDSTPSKIKNIGIWLRYDSRSGTHNMYREYRELTVSAAVTHCCKSHHISTPHSHCFLLSLSLCSDRDMAARHRARASSIQIIRAETIPASKCRRPHVKQFHVSLALHFIYMSRDCQNFIWCKLKVKCTCFTNCNSHVYSKKHMSWQQGYTSIDKLRKHGLYCLHLSVN